MVVQGEFGVATELKIVTCRSLSRSVVSDQMIRQVSRGSAGEYQADERAGVAGLSWRGSG